MILNYLKSGNPPHRPQRQQGRIKTRNTYTPMCSMSARYWCPIGWRGPAPHCAHLEARPLPQELGRSEPNRTETEHASSCYRASDEANATNIKHEAYQYFHIFSYIFSIFPRYFLDCFWYFIGSEPLANKNTFQYWNELWDPGALRTFGTKTSIAIRARHRWSLPSRHQDQLDTENKVSAWCYTIWEFKSL